MRVRLTDAERAAKRKERWARIVNQPKSVLGVGGDAEDWRAAFRARFGVGATTAAGVTGNEAELYFELPAGYSADDVRRAFKRRMRIVHPDVGGNVDEARRCIELYDLLREQAR